MKVKNSNFQEILYEASYEAGKILKRLFKKKIKVEKKGAINLVTEADFASEEKIKEILSRYYPQIPFLAEESGGEMVEGLLWLIDPLDGTTNFAHKIPFYAISIALYRHPQVLAASIYVPEFNEFYYAEAGKGAFLNGQKIYVSETPRLSESIISTGFPYDVWTNSHDVISYFKAFLLKARAIRRFGAASIDLAYVARGIFESHFELRLKPWDTAAGFLLIEEAGGKVTNFSGKKYHPFMSEILASNGKIHQEMLDTIKGIKLS